MSTFYDNILNGKYSAYEKTASTQEKETRDALSSLSTEQLDKLAMELGVLTKEASETDFNDMLLFEDELEKEAGIKKKCKEKCAEGEEELGDPTKVQAKEKCAEEDEEIEEEYEGEEKTAEEQEYEMYKQACEEVEEQLVNDGHSLDDYMFHLTGLEKHANELAVVVDKIARVYDIPTVMAANDLVEAMTSLANQE